MKNSWHIYTTDLRKIGTNWVAAIIIGGLILLPSLYAWFNIKASWDPYGQTNQIPVGIVNEDQGSSVRGEKVHAGDELVKTLKKNNSFDWKFTSRKKAMDKAEFGDYYAVIVIPKDFSEKLATVIQDKPQKATVEYYVNEKINAIAPKITSKGATVIVDQISSSFISTVNGTIFDIFNKLGIELQENLPDIEKFQNYIFKMEKKLPDIKKTLDSTYSDAKDADKILAKAQGMVPEAKQGVQQGLNTIDKTTKFLNDAQKRLDDMAPKVKKDLDTVQKVSADVSKFVNDIQSLDINWDKGEQLSNDIQNKITDGIKKIDRIENALQELQKQNNADQSPGVSQVKDNVQDRLDRLAEELEGKYPGSTDAINQTMADLQKEMEKLNNGKDSAGNRQKKIENVLGQLEVLKQALQEVQQNSGELKGFVKDKKQQVDEDLTKIKDVADNTNNRIGDFVNEYNNKIEPTIRKEVASAKNTLTKARGMLVEVQQTIPEVERLLGSSKKNLGDGEEVLKYTLNQYPYVHSKVSELADKIRDIQKETNIHDIIQLLENDPKAEKSFFEQPVKLNENKLFPIANYGTGMTPFYTVLAIWVGALLLISLLATDVHNAETSYKTHEIYFGRLFTFITIGLLQTLVVILGDMFIVDVEVKEAGWFILFGVIISLIFITLVYTLVSLFGDVGKAIAIIFLVLQIAGAGGTYPVALLPHFFQVISPFLPFTHAIGLMREAVGGIVWARVYHDLLFLIGTGVIFLLLGCFLKAPLNKQTNKMAKKSRESGVFH